MADEKKSVKAKSPTKKSSKPKKAKMGKKMDKEMSKEELKLRLVERRKHPRFLLSREQFREVRTGRIFPVYDLSLSGLSIRIEEQYWPPGTVLQGVLNLHPDSLEITPRVLDYYEDRAALKLEALSTYARSVLIKALSPKRLGGSLQLVREKVPLADYWYHGVCNTDLLFRLNPRGEPTKAELFFSNFYWSWSESTDKFATGVCQSIGIGEREEKLMNTTLGSDEPIQVEPLELAFDAREDLEKTRWAKGIIEAAQIDPRLKEFILKKFENP